MTAKEKTKFQKEKAKTLYLAGHTISEIVEEVDLSFYTIQAYLKKEGVLKKRKYLNVEDKQRLILRLFKEGKEIIEIVTELNIPIPTVKSVLRQSNLLVNKQSQ